MHIEGKEFDRGDLVRHIAERTGLSVADVAKVVEWVPIAIADAVVEFDRVKIHGFGVFTLLKRSEDSGVLPNGNEWSVPERLKLVFRPSKAIQEQIANRMQVPVI